MMIEKDLEGSRRDVFEVIFRNSLRGTEDNHDNPSQVNLWSGRDSKRVPPENESRALPLDHSARLLYNVAREII
jgi:hypothetical protein